MPATPRISTSPSPSRRHSSRAAMSPSFNGGLRYRRPLEKRSEMFEVQQSRELVEPGLARVGRLGGDAAQRRERRARARLPGDVPNALTRAAHRQVMAADPEREVVRDDVRPGKERQRRGRNQPEAVDREPEPVALEVAIEPAAQDLARLRFGEVVGMHEAALVLPPQQPEQTLLGYRLSDPPHHAAPDPR